MVISIQLHRLRDATRGRGVAYLLAAALLVATPALAQTGVITGTVRDAATHEPVLTGLVLCVVDASWCRPGWTTDALGVYRAEVSPGTYVVYTWAAGTAYIDEIFPDIYCPGTCAFATALQSGGRLVVAANATVRADFDLDRGGAIAGSVTDAQTGAPLSGVMVTAYLTGDHEPLFGGSGTTDAAGHYLIQGLAGGQYSAYTYEPYGTYVNEVYDNITCGPYCSGSELLEGTPIAVTAGLTSDGRDFALAPGGRIAGTVTDAVTMLPVPGACVFAIVNLAGGPIDVANTCTDLAGTYEIDGLPGGAYLLMTMPPPGSSYVPELYEGIPCPAGACDLSGGTAVSVTAGTTSAGKDVALDTGGTIRGIVRDALAPQAPISGQVVIYTRSGGDIRIAGYDAVDYMTGDYSVTGLPDGTYYAFTSVFGLRNEIFDDVRCQAALCADAELTSSGTAVAVSGGSSITGIDFALRNDLVPGIPQHLNAIVDGSTVTLTWASADMGGAPSGYVLDAGPSPGTTFVQQSTVETRLVVGGVPPGRYFVRVRAVNATGSSEATDDILVTVPAANVPPAASPVNLEGWMSGSRLTLTWGDPPATSGLTGYVVEAGSASGLTNIACIGVNARALTFIPVPAGYYFVRVRAMNAYGIGPASNEVLINAGNVPAPPGTPLGLESRVSGSTVTLNWLPPYGDPPTGYVLRAGSAPGLSNLAEAGSGPSETALTFSGVPMGVYYVRVHAVGAVGVGPASVESIVIVR